MVRLSLAMFALVCGEASGKPRDEVVISTITRGLLNGPEAKVSG